MRAQALEFMKRKSKLVVAAAALLLGGGLAALAANPSFPNKTGDIRQDAPDEPGFDRAEPDDASGDYRPGTSVFDEN